MISRRSFLKVSGLAAVALSTGYGAGKLTVSSKNRFFAIHGFIPADEKILRQLISSFTDKVQPSENPMVFADSQHTSIIKETYEQRTNRTERGSVKIRLTKVNAQVQGDILVSDNDSAILNPENFNSSFAGIRSIIQNRKAEYFITAEFQENNMLSFLLDSGRKTAVIENEKGIVDKISLGKSYKSIDVDGPTGKTVISMSDGSIGIHSAACRNQICKHSGHISETGQIIACAPGKVLIKIETV